MTTTTLTSKGQLTLPKAIRDRLHLRVGDRLEVTLREDGVILMEPVTVDVSQLKGIRQHAYGLDSRLTSSKIC